MFTLSIILFGLLSTAVFALDVQDGMSRNMLIISRKLEKIDSFAKKATSIYNMYVKSNDNVKTDPILTNNVTELFSKDSAWESYLELPQLPQSINIRATGCSDAWRLDTGYSPNRSKSTMMGLTYLNADDLSGPYMNIRAAKEWKLNHLGVGITGECLVGSSKQHPTTIGAGRFTLSYIVPSKLAPRPFSIYMDTSLTKVARETSIEPMATPPMLPVSLKVTLDGYF